MIRMAIIGAGHWGPNLLRNFHNRQRSEVMWVVDRDPDRLAQVRERFPDVRTADDAAAALHDPQVDAVVVATPTSTHYPLAKAALELGKHVLVEKPMALDLVDCEAMIAACRSAGVALVVGHSHSFDAPIRRTREIATRGEFGAVRLVQSLNYTDFLYRPRRPEELP